MIDLVFSQLSDVFRIGLIIALVVTMLRTSTVTGRVLPLVAGVVFGTAVIGRLNVPQPPAITLPWAALSSAAGQPAIWKVDPAALSVAQVPVTISAYGGDTITLSGGVTTGDIVVTDGSQLLFPGRSVALMEMGE